MSLEEERKKASFNPTELTQFLYPNYLVPQLTLARIIELNLKCSKIPELNYALQKFHDTRQQDIIRAYQFGQALKSFSESEKLTRWERRFIMGFYPELTAHVAQYEFFIPSFALQANEEQKRLLLPKMESLEITGCYAQTELGHGSNVRGIETQAIYDEKTQQFIMHSPTITSYKWWIGGLGLTATHALVAARLIAKGNDYGPHIFLVQIRDTKTRKPLDGVDVGDIGPKFGLNGNDNGFLKFDYYRVPFDAMLNRFARLTPEGDYELLDPNGIKILYATLVSLRAGIVTDSWYRYACALTISIRYSLVREQFPDHENPNRERMILDYQIQRHKLFKNLARLYGHVFAKKPVSDHYDECERRLFKGDDSLLAESHALVSLYKVYVSHFTVQGLEECRRSCGGHGYMMLSGLPSLYMNHLPTVTYDGDNNILALQAARYLITLMKKPNPQGVFGFLNTPMPDLSICPDIKDSTYHQICFEAVAKLKVQSVYRKEQDLISKGFKKPRIWNEFLQVEGIEATEAVYHASLHFFYIEGISKISNLLIRNAVEILRLIYVSTELAKYHADLIRLGMPNSIFEQLKEVQLDSLDRTRPNALALIEAFEISETTLNSVIGRKDGKIYQNMVWTSKYMNPVNKGKVFPGIHRYLRPKL